MGTYKVAFIGTGKIPEKRGPMGYAMAYRHADGYALLADDCEMVACADIVEANAQGFADAYGIKEIFTDYREMLDKVKPDIVSISTWPSLHAEMTIACCEAGVKAVHCEKPMAQTWGDSRRMAEAAEKSGTKLTFNHQRRFGFPMRKARELIVEGRIGDLVRMEAHVGDLYDGGTHWVDMLSYFNGETPAEWVIGQIDGRREVRIFGAPVENQGIVHVKYRNGVAAIIVTGPEAMQLGPPWRIAGTDGTIEIGGGPAGRPMLRFMARGMADWEEIDTNGEHLHGPGYIERAVADIVKALKEDGESELCARNALIGTEIIFACYESSRRRGRIDLPLTIDDNPLEAMLASGDMGQED
jgi:predicted dehydrogenase